MQKSKTLKLFTLLIIVLFCVGILPIVNLTPLPIISAQTTLEDDSPILPIATETQFTANLTKGNFSVVAIRTADINGGDLTLNLYEDSSYSTVLESADYMGFKGFTFIAYNGKDLTGLKNNYYDISTTQDWDEIIIEMENGMTNGLIEMQISDYFGDFAVNEIIDTYIVDLNPDVLYDISLDSVSSEDYDLYLAGVTEFCNPGTTFARSDAGLDSERIIGSVLAPGKYCIIVTNPHNTDGSYALNFDRIYDDSPFTIPQPAATTGKYAWDVYKNEYSLVAAKAMNTVGGVFTLTSYQTSTYQTEKNSIEFTGNAGLLYIISNGMGLISNYSTEYFTISPKNWETIILEMENGQGTGMNLLPLDSSTYSNLKDIEIIDTYLLNLNSSNMYNISLDVPHNADLDIRLAGPTTGGNIGLVAESKRPGFDNDEFIYYTPEVDGIFCLIITKLIDVLADYYVEAKIYSGDPTDTDGDGIPDEVDFDDDNDLIPDNWELKNLMNPKDSSDAAEDFDNDNLTNLEEYFGADISPAGSDSLDPNDRDSDGDGFDDSEELVAGTDPLNLLDFPFDEPVIPPAAYTKSYSDAAGDECYWEVNSINMEDFKYGMGGYPDYDIINLESRKVENNLSVELQVTGKVQDLIIDEENHTESAVYLFYFVESNFTETFDGSAGIPQMYIPDDFIGFYTFAYYNGSFDGTVSTNGIKTDDTLTWNIPLKELEYLPEDFGIFATSYYVKAHDISDTEFVGAWAYDAAGLGAKDMGNGNGNGEVPKETVTVTIDDNVITVAYSSSDDGVVEINNVTDKPPGPKPVDAEETGIYVDITSTSGTVNNLFIKVTYDDNDLSENVTEADLKLFYYDEALDKWVLAEETGVWTNNNTVWAKVDHLTIFSPMAQKGAEEDEGDEGGLPMDLIMMILIIVIILVVILVVIGVAVKRSKKRRKGEVRPERGERGLTAADEAEAYPPPAEYEAYEEGYEEEPSQEPEYTPEYKNCPKCRAEIEVPYSYEDKVSIKCHSCGARGRIPNPYQAAKPTPSRAEKPKKPPKKREPSKKTRERRKPKKEEPEEEDIDWADDEEEEVELKYIKCPKCKDELEVPHSDLKKISIKCYSCGAKGSISNPYLK